MLINKIENKTAKVGVIGLGYVGLPLAVEFSKKYQTIGFDIDDTRIKELKEDYDYDDDEEEEEEQ